jgi:hypothetical protein
MNKVRIDAKQQRYVIDCGEGYACLGFANARDHANQMARRLGRADLAFMDEDYATLAGYEKHLRAVEAWRESPLNRSTYFDPGTHPEAAKVLEAARHRARKVRLILGDTATGEPWLAEHDVVGQIARSTGGLKVPLLIDAGRCGGSAIPCACILPSSTGTRARFCIAMQRIGKPISASSPRVRPTCPGTSCEMKKSLPVSRTSARPVPTSLSCAAPPSSGGSSGEAGVATHPSSPRALRGGMLYSGNAPARPLAGTARIRSR